MNVIWFIDKDAAPTEFYATQKRTTQFAQHMQNKGDKVYVFCSSFVHGRNIELIEDNSVYKELISDDITYVLVKTNQKTSSFKSRVLSYFKFSLKILKALKYFPKPNIVVHNSKTPFDILVTRLKKKTKAKYIVDIADLWPEEFAMHGILKKESFLMKFFYRLERYVYSLADSIVFSFEGGKDYIRLNRLNDKKVHNVSLDKVYYINTGISLSEYNYNYSHYKIEDPDLDSNLFKVVYLGSIRRVNNLLQLIEAAKCLRDRKDIIFIIYGDGDEREELEDYCKNNNLNNILFKNKWIEPKYVPSVLSRASVNLLNYAPNFGKWGWSMNKMFHALASSKPMICNANLGYSIINSEGIGTDEIFKTSEEYANCILKYANMPKSEYDLLCERVHKVSQSYDSIHLCNMFENIINN